MLNLMPIPHVLQMNEIFPTSRTTDDSGRRMLTGGPDVCDSQARGNDIATPPPFRREKPNVPAQRSGEPFFQQKRFPVPRISVPGRKHTFLLVVL